MNITQPTVETSGTENLRVVPETSAALSTGMFQPIGGLDPDMSPGTRDPKPRAGRWPRFRPSRG